MRAPATEVKNRFGEFIERAQRGPITVEQSGRDVAVLVSTEDFARMQAIEDRHWAERALDAAKSGFVGHDEAMRVLNDRLAALGDASA